MYNWTSMNKMLSSKPIYSTCFSCLSTFKRIKNINCCVIYNIVYNNNCSRLIINTDRNMTMTMTMKWFY